MAKICIIDSNKIENGGSLMYENTDLINWNSDLSNLTTSDAMFSGCESLVSLPVVTNGQRFYLNEITSLPIFCTMMFGIIPHSNVYFSEQGYTPRLPLPSEINYDLNFNLGYEIDRFNPQLTLFCDDINTLISNTFENNGYGMEISFLVHGRHLKGSQEDGGNTIEILSAMASRATFAFNHSLGIVTATEKAINEFISNGWEIVSEDDETYLSIIND